MLPLLVKTMCCASHGTTGGLLNFVFFSVGFSDLCFANEAKDCKFFLRVFDYMNLKKKRQSFQIF